MKKLRFGLLGILLGMAVYGGINCNRNVPVRAEEPETIENIFVEETYTTVLDDVETTLTLFSETECKIEGKLMGSVASIQGTYTREGNKVSVHMLDETFCFVLNDDGTFSEEEPIVEPEPTIEHSAQVVVNECSHGTVEADILEGEIGDICTLTVKHDILYKIDCVMVNGAVLVEDEHVTGKYCFALAEGNNEITALFKVDEELCGELTGIIKQATEKDWTNLFTLDNVLVIIKWVFDGGVLIALSRYFIKDKKLADKVEGKVGETVEKLIPEQTKTAVMTAIETAINPLFVKMSEDNGETKKAVQSMVKCFILSQQNTPESKIAIVDELSNLKISDNSTVNDVKDYIMGVVEKMKEDFNSTISSLNSISEKNKEIIESHNEKELDKEENKNTYDGTTI